MNTAYTRRAAYPALHSHRQCVKCGKLVSRAAYACRRCGKRQRLRPRTLLIALSGCLVAGMVAVASAGAFLGAPNPPETAPAWPKAEAAPSLPRAASQVTA